MSSEQTFQQFICEQDNPWIQDALNRAASVKKDAPKALNPDQEEKSEEETKVQGIAAETIPWEDVERMGLTLFGDLVTVRQGDGEFLDKKYAMWVNHSKTWKIVLKNPDEPYFFDRSAEKTGIFRGLKVRVRTGTKEDTRTIDLMDMKSKKIKFITLDKVTGGSAKKQVQKTKYWKRNPAGNLSMQITEPLEDFWSNWPTTWGNEEALRIQRKLPEKNSFTTDIYLVYNTNCEKAVKEVQAEYLSNEKQPITLNWQ